MVTDDIIAAGVFTLIGTVISSGAIVWSGYLTRSKIVETSEAAAVDRTAHAVATTNAVAIIDEKVTQVAVRTDGMSEKIEALATRAGHAEGRAEVHEEDRAAAAALVQPPSPAATQGTSGQ